MKSKKQQINYKFKRKGTTNYNNTTKTFSKSLQKVVKTTDLNYKKSILMKMDCLVGSKKWRAK